MAKILSVFLWISFVFQNIEAFKDIKSIEEKPPIQTFNNNENDRTARSTDGTPCLPMSPVNKTFAYDESHKFEIICGCLPIKKQAITWLDVNCKKVASESHVVVTNQSLILTSPSLNSSVFYCTNDFNCTYKISVSGKETITGMSRALQGFIMFIVIIGLLAIAVLVYRKCKYQIYLGCRDCCSSNTAADGKEFDVYISVGKSVSDIKFVEKNIVDYLQMKCNYKVFLDEDNLLPRLDYSEKVQTKMHLCRRLIIVFTPAYMTNEWCMYCFSEGLRKILDLQIDVILVVTDLSIQRELSTLSPLIGHVPKLFLSTANRMQSESEKNKILQKLRILMPPSPQGGSYNKAMKVPMLHDAEDIDRRSLRDTDSYGGTKYTKGSTDENNDLKMEDFDLGQQEMEYDDEDPSSIRIKQYKTRKDFFRIALVEDADEKD